jgi:APA family basic amino acid/polyamine antiporter
VLVTIPVPANIPIDAPLPEQEAAAQSIIEEAKVQAGRRVSGHWEKVRAGQTGRQIVDEARELHAEAIVMPMKRGGAGFGRALETVLRERPCRVIIESTPERVRERRPPVPA